MNIDAYREEFALTRTHTYLNHASCGVLPQRAARAAERVLRQHQSVPFEEVLPEFVQLLSEVKGRIATLIGAVSPDEVVLMPNTSSGLNAAANSLPLRSGDNVVVLEGDYPANIYPWWNLAHRGVFTKMLPQREGGLELDLLATRVDERTQVVAVSSVIFSTGHRTDLQAVGEFCHERGIFFVVDGIQSLGALPLDVEACHIDMLACGSHKWLLSGPGCGFFYCREGIMDQLQPGAYVGPFSVVDPYNFLDYNFTLQPGAERFALGTHNHLGLATLNAALELLLEAGPERVGARILELVAAARADLEGRGLRVLSNSKRPSGILTVSLPDPEAAHARLLQAKIVTSVRGGALRLSPHFYNTLEEVRRVGEVLGK